MGIKSFLALTLSVASLLVVGNLPLGATGGQRAQAQGTSPPSDVQVKPSWVDEPDSYFDKFPQQSGKMELAVGSSQPGGATPSISKRIAVLNAKKQLAMKLYPEEAERSADGSTLSISVTLRGARTLASWVSPEGRVFVLVGAVQTPTGKQ